jgi:putative dimethyl sulfoxide reductase chaperone
MAGNAEADVATAGTLVERSTVRPAIEQIGQETDEGWAVDANRRVVDEPARAALYHIASAALAYPTPELAVDLKNGSLLTAASDVAASYGWAWYNHQLAQWASTASAPDLFAALEPEYIALFVVNPWGLPAPPYAGFYLDGNMNGRTAGYLTAQYRASGLVLTARYANQPDHLAVQTEYLHLLAGQGAERYEAHAPQILRILLRWLPAFHRRVRKAATLPFYPTFTGWLLELASHDLRALSKREWADRTSGE